MELMERFRHPEAVVDETFGGVPATVGIEDDEQEIAAVLGNLGDETPAGLGREAGLHPFNAGNVTQEPIGRVQYIGTLAGDRRDDFPFFSDELPEDGIFEGHFTELGQVFRRGVVIRIVESTAVAEMRIR